MIKHCVLLRVAASAAPEAVERAFAELAALRETIPGFVDFAIGPNTSPEGLSQGFTHAFVTTFTDAAARDAYLVHPAHQAAAGSLLAVLEGGVSGVIVVDFEAAG